MKKTNSIADAKGSFLTAAGDTVVTQNTKDFVREAMKIYGDEVIHNRSLPRLEDGLRPVQRLLFWSCMDLAQTKFMKAAKITGHCIASYSPHGEKAAYDSLVRMVRERYPLTEGQGNFGSATTSAASARYTESRLHPFGKKLIADLPDLQFSPKEKNYDDSLDQPVYLPCVLPNILLNAGAGIAVGITSKIPGFNVEEVANAVQACLDGKSDDVILSKITAPDLAHCTITSPAADTLALLKTGDGSIEYECAYKLETKGKAKLLVITGYAPEFSVSGFLLKCGNLQDQNVVQAVRNETSEDNGDRIVIQYDTDEDLAKLLKLIKKKVSYKFNVLVDDGAGLTPKMMGVVDIVKRWVESRKTLTKETIKQLIVKQALELRRQEAKLKVCSDRKGLFAALDDSGDFCEALVKYVGLTAEEALLVSRMQIDSLKKASVEELKRSIEKDKKDIEKLQADMEKPEQVIKKQIQDLIKWCRSEYPAFFTRQTTIKQPKETV